MDNIHFGESIIRDDWKNVDYFLGPNARFDLYENRVIIPYHILGGYLFDADRPDALNIASGLVLAVAHEITHGFDNIGGQFDHEGKFQSKLKKDMFVGYSLTPEFHTGFRRLNSLY